MFRLKPQRATESATERQVGGKHYMRFKIQPIEFIMANKLNFIQGCIIKYICRFKTIGSSLGIPFKIIPQPNINLVLKFLAYAKAIDFWFIKQPTFNPKNRLSGFAHQDITNFV